MPTLSSFLKVLTLSSLLTPILAQTNFPPVTVWAAGQLSQSTPGRFCDFTNGGFAQFQGDGNVVVYTAQAKALWNSIGNGGGKGVPGAPAQQCPGAGPCLFQFQGDGNFVAYFDGAPLWNTGTAGRGAWLVCQEVSPYLYIVDGAGNIIWET